jgi:acetyl-CoA/propionyl-CoA carboxylase biotin carboxyl carrier protein
MRRVLIANRGEIAVRVARACADYGVESVAVYAGSDADAPHVELADAAYALDGDTAAETYLDIDKLIDVARRSGADAVHPGYGFLSESSRFAAAVIEAGLVWIGPSPESIDLLGDKVAARRIAERVGAPLVAGTSDPVEDAAGAVRFAQEFGLPIAIKAAFGGGGRGLKVARTLDEVAELFDSAVREAITAFGRGECFVEQFLDRPRHIEAQVLADAHGSVVVLGTRDCSLQRRNQKLVEEAPAPFLTDEQRERIHAAARDICAAAGYQGAATVEFLLSADGTISFLEVNTRLQVEHPVTEETTGVDIVVEQLRIADGLPLTVTSTPVVRGHSFEFRINAEDPGRGFLPTPGTVSRFRPPSGPGVRLDSGVDSGSVVSGRFDSMLAKLIVTGSTREHALARARRALAEFEVEGLATVLPFHRAVVRDVDFTGRFAVHTQWIETEFAERMAPQPPVDVEEPAPLTRVWIEVDGRRVRLGLPPGLLDGASAPTAPVQAAAPAAAAGEVTAPMAGTLARWLVADGDVVAAGDPIAVMEAMKMEALVSAPRSGAVSIAIPAGQPVVAGAVLGRLD